MKKPSGLSALFAFRREELPFAFLMSGYFFLVITTFWILKPLKKSLFIGFYDTSGFTLLATVLTGAQVAEVVVRTDEDARRLHFLGSPSIRVNGVDIEPGADARRDYALACRIYGSSGLPERALLASALRAESDEG